MCIRDRYCIGDNTVSDCYSQFAMFGSKQLLEIQSLESTVTTDCQIVIVLKQFYAAIYLERILITSYNAYANYCDVSSEIDQTLKFYVVFAKFCIHLNRFPQSVLSSNNLCLSFFLDFSCDIF